MCTTESGSVHNGKTTLFSFFVSMSCKHSTPFTRARVTFCKVFERFAASKLAGNGFSAKNTSSTRIVLKRQTAVLPVGVVSRFTCIRIIYRDKNIYPLIVSRQTKGGKLSRWFRVRGFFIFNTITRVRSGLRLRLYEHNRNTTYLLCFLWIVIKKKGP